MAADRSDLQAQLEGAERRASHLERELGARVAECRELASLQRELNDLRALTQSQEQRVAQSHREAQQSKAELASLEAILALLHRQEVGSHGHTCGHIYDGFIHIVLFVSLSHEIIVTVPYADWAKPVLHLSLICLPV